MQCNYNTFIQIINFHGLFRNALRCRKTGACRILVPLRYFRPTCGNAYSYYPNLLMTSSYYCRKASKELLLDMGGASWLPDLLLFQL